MAQALAALILCRPRLMQVNARVMGVVLNAFNVHGGEGYYNYYGSKYASRYYEQPEEEKREANAS